MTVTFLSALVLLAGSSSTALAHGPSPNGHAARSSFLIPRYPRLACQPSSSSQTNDEPLIELSLSLPSPFLACSAAAASNEPDASLFSRLTIDASPNVLLRPSSPADENASRRSPTTTAVDEVAGKTFDFVIAGCVKRFLLCGEGSCPCRKRGVLLRAAMLESVRQGRLVEARCLVVSMNERAPRRRLQ